MVIGRNARLARLLFAVGLASCAAAIAGPGEVLVSSRLSSNVLEFDAATGSFIQKFVQMGQADPSDLVIGPDGDLYITDMAHASVHRYDGKTRQYKGQFVKAGSGGLGSPQSLIFGPNGNLFVTGTPDSTIVEFDGATGDYIRTVFSLGSTVPGQITFGPEDGLIYYVCQTCRNVKVVDPETGLLLRILVQNDQDGPYIARGMAWGPGGNVFLTSGGVNDTIREYDGKTGKFVRTFASGGGLDEPYDVIFGAANVMYVSGGDSNNVAMFNAETGAYLGQAASFGQGGLQKAGGLAEMSVRDCYADFSGDALLDLFDFLSFMNGFNAGHADADCDADGDRDLFDFLCFQNAFVAGC